MTETPLERVELRRSTRVPIRVRIQVRGSGIAFEGETIVVSAHGALLEVSEALSLGAEITVAVQLTGKSAPARVVFVSRERPSQFGIALDHPQNIWGVSLPPPDWHEYSEGSFHRD